MVSLVLTDSSQPTADGFEKLSGKIMYPYAEPYDLQTHVGLPSSATTDSNNSNDTGGTPTSTTSGNSPVPSPPLHNHSSDSGSNEDKKKSKEDLPTKVGLPSSATTDSNNSNDTGGTPTSTTSDSSIAFHINEHHYQPLKPTAVRASNSNSLINSSNCSQPVLKSVLNSSTPSKPVSGKF
uniref:Uncharacterized protein n=1 Tax=Timema cristinae TaxID=61476 RepID=A0A7R9H9J9_TIMCR|nr:unnamed protein product [Timema cristinae]